jgi:hypothetical protein
MADPNALDVLRIPSHALIALDWRPLHFALQPVHHILRMAHVLATAAFFGGIVALDLRLIGGAVPLRPLASHLQPYLYTTFGVSVVTGAALFLYDPAHVGSHAYFTLKLVLIVVGLANAALFHLTGYAPALAADTRLPVRARVTGAASIVLWTGVVICACLNVEAAPKVMLR